MAKETNLHDIFIDELRDAYHAEKQLVKALPKMAKAATSPELRAALESHLEETQTHVERILQAFELLGEPAKAKPCAGMQGIIEEGSDVIKEEDKGAALDAAIIASGQRAEHYEMAAYGSLISWANAMSHTAVAELLEQTLEEEKAADAKLTELAEGGINAEAAGEQSDMRQDDADDSDDEDDVETRKGGRAKTKPAAAKPAMAKSGRR